MQQPQQHLAEEYLGQAPNEFMPMAGAEFIPRPEYVNHNAPHIVSPIPVFEQQEDGTFQTFPAEFIPARAAQSSLPPIQNADENVTYLQPELSPVVSFNNNDNNSVINFKQSDPNERNEQSTQPTYDAAVATNEINTGADETPYPVAIQDETVNMKIAQQTPNANVVVVTATASTAAPTVPTEPIRLAATETHVQHTINALANVSIEKQTIKFDRAMATTKTSVSTLAWTPKKSTQSVAVSAVPSNTISQIETGATKTQSQTGVRNKLAVNSNNNNNSSSSNVNITGGSNTNELATNNNINVKPIVPKVDDTNVTEFSSTARDAVTSQSSEVQTIPVALPVEAAPSVEPTTPPSPPAAAPTPAPTAAAPPTNSWASLFSKGTSSSGIQMDPNGIQTAANSRKMASIGHPATKKPVAKVSPYNSTSNEQQSAKSFSGAAVPTPVAPTPIAHSAGTLSYSAASTQKLPSPNTASAKKEVPVRARVAPSSKATSSTETQHIDESSYRIGGE